MFVVRCPKCKLTMRYQAIKHDFITNKKKTCVYCNHTFKIHASLIKSNIVREEPDNTTTPLFHSAKQIEEFKQKLDNS